MNECFGTSAETRRAERSDSSQTSLWSYVGLLRAYWILFFGLSKIDLLLIYSKWLNRIYLLSDECQTALFCINSYLCRLVWIKEPFRMGFSHNLKYLLLIVLLAKGSSINHMGGPFVVIWLSPPSPSTIHGVYGCPLIYNHWPRGHQISIKPKLD